MSLIRKLVLTSLAVGLTVSVPLTTQAGPRCTSGGPTCSAGTTSPCPSYCQQQGWPLGLCVLATGCCYCTD